MKNKKIRSVASNKLNLVSYVGLFAYAAGILMRNFALVYSQNAAQAPSDKGVASWAELFSALSRVSTGVFVIASIYVTAQLGWRYLPFRSPSFLKHLDERQKALRLSVAEWSYRSIGLWGFVTLSFMGPDDMFSDSYYLWMLVGLFFFMPSLIAAHRKGA